MEILTIVVTGLLPILGYFLKTVIEDVKELRQHLSEFKEEVPKVYTPKTEFERDFNRIMERFDRLDKKLDSAIGNRRAGD
jgi:uncharacterized protein YdcH (DUF465 family)